MSIETKGLKPREEWRARVLKDKDRIQRLAEELYDLERDLTIGAPMLPSSMEISTSIVRCRWALLGLVTEGG